MPGGISYNGTSLQTINILTQDIDHASHPVKNLTTRELSHSNKSVIPFISHPNKIINVSGEIVDTSIAAVDARLDLFRGIFVGKDLNLDIEYNGSIRRYIATPFIVNATRPGGLLYGIFAVQFFCTYPFGYDTTPTTLLNRLAQTTSPYQPSITFLGTAPTQTPIITLTYTAMTGNTGIQTVVIGNGATGQAISIARVWVSTDIVIIDTLNKVITVNGVSFPPLGAFPEFKFGAASMYYLDNFTTRTYNFNVSATTAYI